MTPLSLCKGVSSNMAIGKWMKMTVLEVTFLELNARLLCLAKYNTSTLYILKLNIFNALHSMFELQLEMKYSIVFSSFPPHITVSSQVLQCINIGSPNIRHNL